MPNGVVNPVTGIPVANSPVLGKGLTIPWIRDDLYHNPRTGAYDIGAVQHGGAIIPPPPNQLPVAIAGAAQTITLPVNNTTLDGSKSYDPDGSITKYAWSQSSGPTPATIANPTRVSSTISGLQAGVYVFKLIVTDVSGATSADSLVVTVDNVSVNKGNGYNDQLILFPNPSHDATTVRITSSTNGTIRLNVYDMNGKLVFTDQMEKSLLVFEKTFNVSPLASGMYTVQIIIGNHTTMVTKFIKQ